MTPKPIEPVASRPYMPAYGILPADEGEGLLPWSWAVERLEAARNYFVATNWPGHPPQVSAVWGVWIDDRFYFSSDDTSRKARNLAADPACTVAIDVTDNETVMVEGTASKEDQAQIIRRFVKVYEPKYDWSMDPMPGAVYAVRPLKVLGIGAEPFAGTATRWSFER
jgi:hypothetical protein